ncbi:MAG: hypothetical protein ACD_18C00059G0003 [uncultured bacterium]|nr:MAG: hypothetical protein ACD_18C00059G0003 [uncultured bacterium]
MKIEIFEVQNDEKEVLKQLLELYQYDFSIFNDADVDDIGLYSYKHLDSYFDDPKRKAFFIKYNNKYCGFVMINDYLRVLKNEGSKAVAEFFVLKKYRRLGIGKYVSEKMFGMFPGKWEIFQQKNNEGAVDFWQNVIKEYTKNNYEIKDVIDNGVDGQVFIFNNSK